MNRHSTLPLLAVLLYASPGLADDNWRFNLTPYLWFAGLKGDVATIPGAPAAPIDISPKDALDDTETGIMVMLDAKKGRHGIYTDIIYTDVRSDTSLVPAPINLTLRSKTKTTIFTLAYEYEVYRNNATSVDLLAGARYWNLDSELKFGNGLGLLAGRKVSNEESWIDPVVGAKGHAPLGNTRFYIDGGIGFGGFGVGSDNFFEWNAAVGYQWTKDIGTALGYRMFDVDYDDDGFLYDVRQEGWQLGLTWSF